MILKNLDRNLSIRFKRQKRCRDSFYFSPQLLFPNHRLDVHAFAFANFSFSVYNDLEKKAAENTERPNESRLFRSLAKVAYHNSVRIRYGEAMYFGRIGNQTEQEALQYAMFLRLADKLNIDFVDDDVQKLMTSDVAGVTGAP